MHSKALIRSTRWRSKLFTTFKQVQANTEEVARALNAD